MRCFLFKMCLRFFVKFFGGSYALIEMQPRYYSAYFSSGLNQEKYWRALKAEIVCWENTAIVDSDIINLCAKIEEGKRL